jgi:ribosomal protein S6
MAEEPRSEEGQTQADSSEKAPVYEVGFHIVPTVAEPEVAAVVAKIKSALGAAEIIKEEAPRKMALAYTIERSVEGKRERYAEAYFGFIKFAAEPAAVPLLQEALRGMREILRFIIISTVREDVVVPRRAVFTSDRLEGKTITRAPRAAERPAGEVSEEELDKSIEALVN